MSDTVVTKTHEYRNHVLTLHGNHAKCRHGSSPCMFQLILYCKIQKLPVVYFVIKDMGVDKIVWGGYKKLKLSIYLFITVFNKKITGEGEVDQREKGRGERSGILFSWK